MMYRELNRALAIL
ncbi:hypothetical protein OFB70_13510 [Escherichia coli]|nr:hypothetical protein [Escherichia coli]